MEPTIFRFIFKYSKRQQIFLLVMTLISFPFLYFSLDLPKTIINKALHTEPSSVPTSIFGYELEQIPYLMALSGAFLILVCINGGFKYYVNVFRGQLGERMLRRLRFDLYARVLRFPLPHFRRISQGEIIPMITAEVEPLGGFIGDAFALPAFQGGTLLTILIFMFVQDWILGLAAIALYPIQMYAIPKLQARVNALGKDRVRNVRQLSNRIGESIQGVQEIHANDGARWTLAAFTDQLGVIYGIRYEIYQRKFFIKFLNNFIAQLTPFFFYSIGGVLVIKGHLSFGALVAVLAAYKDLSAPWKELLNYYQRQADARIKYDQVIEQFDPPGTMPAEQQLGEPDAELTFDGELVANNVTLLDEEEAPIVESINLKVEPGRKLAIVGPSGGGKDVVAMLLARLYLPSKGQMTISGQDMAGLAEGVTGRKIGYVGPSAYIFSSSLRHNILLGAMHAPLLPDETESGASRLAEAGMAGNSVDDSDADWIDYAAIGVSGDDDLDNRLIDLLTIVDLEDDAYNLGLRGTVDPVARPDLADGLLQARAKLRDRLASPELAGLVEGFDEDRFNTNASVAENLLFGTPVGTGFDLDHLAQNPYVLSILEKIGLVDDFMRIGRELAATMVELFADLPPEHEFFSQYSFISADDLPEFQILLARAERLGLENLASEDRDRFLSLPFKLVPARHRLGLIDDDLQVRILEARKAFLADIPEDLRGALEAFSAERYNAAATLQDNILFGKIAYGQADATERVGRAMAEVIQDSGLRSIMLRVGLNFDVGIAGSRLNPGQRQKLAIARVLLRRPAILIFNEATAALDSGSQAKVMDKVLAEAGNRMVIWVTQRAGMASRFEQVVVIQGGQIAEIGAYEDLKAKGGALTDLLGDE